MHKGRMRMDILKEDLWRDVKEIILFGYGKQGRKVLNSLQKDFKIVAIVENDIKKVGKTVNGIPIIHFEEAVELLKKYRVIVTVAEYYYKEIAEQLRKICLIENRDFIMYKQFIQEWYYKFKQKLYILKIDVVVTSLCSLKCKNCSLFLPYWKKKESFDINQLKIDADKLFEHIDYVLDIDIIGGEPFLYKDLDKILLWYGEHYRNRIGHLGIITNGTIVPDKKILDIIKKNNIVVSISDYSNVVNYKSRVDEFCRILEENDIEYMRNTKIQWFDFGFPEHKYSYEGESARLHMQCCNTICNCLNNGRIYYCTTAWAAYKGGLYPDAYKNGIGYVNLDKMDKNSTADRKYILDCCNGKIDDGVIDFCRVCGGYGNDNGNEIETAIQL